MKNIPWSYRLYRSAWNGINLLFPLVCGWSGKLGKVWCPDCQSRAPDTFDPSCDKCGILSKKGGRLEKYMMTPPTYRRMRSLAVFESPVQNALHPLKYRNNIGIGDALARQMTGFVHSLQWDVDVLIPVPLGKKLMKERGYNKVGFVAHPLAYELGMHYAPKGLWKSRDTRSQVGLSNSQRKENVHGAYQADVKIVKRRFILLMDDVATTRSTIQSHAEALLHSEARDVYAMTILRALSHHDMTRV